MKIIATILLLLVLSLHTLAQQTGSFTESIMFQEPGLNTTRDVHYYVPVNYNASNAYPLIVGFRGGPHSSAAQFRDQLQPLSDSLDAIIVCPENIQNFNTQEGQVKLLFRYTVDSVDAAYNIDTNRIYLTGLSFGGRHAVIVGLDTDAGPIPNLRGLIPFAAGTNSENIADYEHTNQFPVCVCIGDQDFTFYNISQTIFDSIDARGGNALLNVVPNVGHSTSFATFPAEMMECFKFIEDNQVGTGRPDLQPYVGVHTYPNPSSGWLTVTNPMDFPISVNLFNMQGQQVTGGISIPGKAKTRISCPENGVFLLEINDGSVKAVRQILVIRQ